MSVLALLHSVSGSMWCRKRFEHHFPKEELRLFPTQKMLFDFIDANPHQQWLPFSIELHSEEFMTDTLSETSFMSHCHGSSQHVAGAKRERSNDFRYRQAYSLLYGSDRLSKQTRFFLASTIGGLKSLMCSMKPSERHLYEIIRENVPCHLYFDVECSENVVAVHEVLTVDESSSDSVTLCCNDETTGDAEDLLSGNDAVSGERFCIPRSEYSRLLKVANVMRSENEFMCPANCRCVTPDHQSTTEQLLRMLHQFTVEHYPHLIPPSRVNDTTTGSPHYACWKEVLVMNSTAPSQQQTKFSQHYLIKLHDGKVFASTSSVGVFVKHFVNYLLETVTTRRQDDKSEGYMNLHSSLCFHGGIRMRSILNPQEVPEAAALPFFTLKCVIDTAVYSKNRMMRCLQSSKLFRKEKLYIQQWNRDGKRVCEEHPKISLLNEPMPGDQEAAPEEDDVAATRAVGMMLNSFISVHAFLHPGALDRIELASVGEVKGNSAGSGTTPMRRSFSGYPKGWEAVTDSDLSVSPSIIHQIEKAFSAMSGTVCSLSAQPHRRDNFFSFSVIGSRYCQHIRREHKSNHVYIVVNPVEGYWMQKCFDPDCSKLKSWRFDFEKEQVGGQQLSESAGSLCTR